MESKYVQETAEIIDIGQARQARTLRGGRGGGTPPTGTGNCWLADMEVGTRFLSKKKNYWGSEVDDWVITTDPTDVAVYLARSVKGRDGYFEWHDPILFCQDNTLIQIRETVEFPNGNNTHIQPGPVERDGDAEVVPPLHEGE